MMERQMAQMVRLIDDLLDVSRITRGKLELRKERVELASVVQSAVEGSRPLIEASGHRLTVALPPEPVWLDADPTRLAQVFANLLTNAAKYTRQGRAHLADRRAGRAARSSSRCKDTGIGIAAEHLPRLFEMFSQVDPALERSQGGLGIGLSLVKGLVEMHGGTRRGPQRGPGQGERVRRPAAGRGRHAGPRRRTPPDGDAGHGPARQTHPGRGRQPGRRRQPRHDAAARRATRSTPSTTARRRWRRPGWFRPDVALLDIGMPRAERLRGARRIREQPWGRNMVLVAITGWGQEEDKRRATEAGFDHHLTKPVDLRPWKNCWRGRDTRPDSSGMS